MLLVSIFIHTARFCLIRQAMTAVESSTNAAGRTAVEVGSRKGNSAPSITSSLGAVQEGHVKVVVDDSQTHADRQPSWKHTNESGNHEQRVLCALLERQDLSNLRGAYLWARLAYCMEDEKSSVTVRGTTQQCTTSVKVKGKAYSQQQCLVRSLELDNQTSAIWMNLSATIDSQAHVFIRGKKVTRRDCFLKALETSNLNAPTFEAMAWSNLGCTLTPEEPVVVFGKTYNRRGVTSSLLSSTRSRPIPGTILVPLSQDPPCR